MTARFLQAMVSVFLHEGGYSDIKEDSGGKTNYGVSLAFLKGLGKKGDINKDGAVDGGDIRVLTKEQANQIYWDNFWIPLYDKLPARLGMKVFDVAVNAGSSRAHKLLQKTLNLLGAKLGEDGIIGGATLAEVAKYSEAQLVETYCKAQANFYRALVAKKPTNARFLEGWLHRAAWVPKTIA